MFKRHSNNKALIQRLGDALKARNYIAHNVIEDYMDHHETRSPNVTRQILRKLKKFEDDGYDLVEELQQDLKKLDNGYDLHRISVYLRNAKGKKS